MREKAGIRVAPPRTDRLEARQALVELAPSESITRSPHLVIHGVRSLAYGEYFDFSPLERRHQRFVSR